MIHGGLDSIRILGPDHVPETFPSSRHLQSKAELSVGSHLSRSLCLPGGSFARLPVGLSIQLHLHVVCKGIRKAIPALCDQSPHVIVAS